MTTVVISPAALEATRLARGMTQVELADASGVSQGYLSQVEKGDVAPDGERCQRFAVALGVSPEFFGAEIADSVAACVHFRKRSRMRVSDAKRVRAELAVRAAHLSLLAPTNGTVSLPTLDLPADGSVTPSDAARTVRRSLNSPDGPLDDLVGQLERCGCVVTLTEAPDIDFDAASLRASGLLVMILNSARPGDRMRYTVAHELGHATLHREPSPNAEAEADEFASELLMPAQAIHGELRNLRFEMLPDLKRRWKVSMAALVRRAFDLDAIGESRYRSLSIELSKAGYRTSEPVKVDCDSPSLLARTVRTRIAAGASIDDIARAAGFAGANLSFHALIGGGIPT